MYSIYNKQKSPPFQNFVPNFESQSNSGTDSVPEINPTPNPGTIFLNLFESAHMKTLREFRLQSKLTQDLIATLLGTTRSQVNLSEKGERRLPPKAANRFKQILVVDELAAHNSMERGVTADDDAQTLTAQLHTRWQAELDEALWQHENLRRKLVKMQEKFELLSVQNAALLRAIDAVIATGAAPPEIDYFKTLQSALQKQLLACDKTAQFRAYVNLHLWREKIKLLEQYINPDAAPAVSAVILDNDALQTSHYHAPMHRLNLDAADTKHN